MPDPHRVFKPVMRCVCGDIRFADLLAADVQTLEDAAELGAGVKCRSCVPYLKRMLATGETEFEVIFDPDS